MEYYLNGAKVRLTPSQAIGKGFEADIFDLGNGQVAKLFKTPDHPDLKIQTAATVTGILNPDQIAAEFRLREHQTKLKAFPKGLPPNVLTPLDLITDKSGKNIFGYTMRKVENGDVLYSYGNRNFRQNGIDNNQVIRIFQDLHTSVKAIHKAGMVIGDFNDLNVLVVNDKVYMIDTDSYQFGQFPCRVFMVDFADPLICEINNGKLGLKSPQSEQSDWYSFNTMLMRCLLFVLPYGGVYAPANVKNKIPDWKRMFQRITIFHSEVRYPKPAVLYATLPDDLLQYFHLVFEKDKREIFPENLLLNLRWTKCTNCGIEHGRSQCPNCATLSPLLKQVTRIVGKVTATRVFQTSGLILATNYQNGLAVLHHENDKYKREDGQVVVEGPLSPNIRFRLQGKTTIIGQGNDVYINSPTKSEQLACDTFRQIPMFDSNNTDIFFLERGRLNKQGEYSPEYIGNVLQNQTVFWVGEKFGFGFYQAGQIKVGFVFDTERRGLNDTVNLPSLRGQLLDASCYIARERCWFFTTSQEGSEKINRCTVVNKNGQVEATLEEKVGTSSWLQSIRGKCAAGNFLLAASDEGIHRVEVVAGQIIETKHFTETRDFVDSSSKLIASAEGIYVVSPRTIHLLKIA